MSVTEKTIGMDFEDGSHSKLTLFTPQTPSACPVVIIFPAMGVTAAYYRSFAGRLAAGNVVVITSDLRGNGHSSVRAGRSVNFGYNEIVELEIKGIVERAQALFPGQKKYIIGHSLGGQLASLFLGKYPASPIDGLILIASCSVYYKGWRGAKRLEILAGSVVCRITAAVLGYFPGNILGFGGREARGVIRDWSKQGLTGKYITANGHDYETGLKNMCIPVLALSYREDSFAPEQAVKNLYGKFGQAAQVNHVLLSDGSRNKSRKSHFGWVKDPEPVMPHMLQFTGSRAE